MTRHFTRSRIFLVPFAVLAMIGLAGCSTFAEPAPAQETLVTQAAPMFASDAEALVAAEAAYRNYMLVVDEIARDGGRSPERAEGFVSAALFEQEAEQFNFFVENTLRSSGTTGIDSFKIQSLQVIEGQQHIRAYVCLDVSDNRLLDSSGSDVTPLERPQRVPLEIHFIVEPKNENPIQLANSDVWSGKNFC